VLKSTNESGHITARSSYGASSVSWLVGV